MKNWISKTAVRAAIALFCVDALAQTATDYRAACQAANECVAIRNAVLQSRQNDLSAGATPLSAGQLLEHMANRFGYGISSSERDFLPDKTTDEDLYKMSYILYSQVFNSDPLLGWANLQKRSSEIASLLSSNFVRRLQDSAFACTNYERLKYNNQYNFDLIPTKNIEETIYDLALSSCNGAMDESLGIRRRLVDYSRQRQVLLKAFGTQYDESLAKNRDLQINYDSVIHEFWFNHFNIETYSSRDDLVGNDSYDLRIEKNKFTNFRTLLGAVMKSPGMLRYLNNNENRYDKTLKAASNQNLGRELLELHTLGIGPKTAQVKSPYNQTDIEVSSLILTGHTILRTKQDGRFFWGYTFSELHAFPARTYDASTFTSGSVSFEKSFWIDRPLALRPILFTRDHLAQLDSLSASQRLDYMLDQLSRHPQTLRNICRKFTSRFVRSKFISDLNSRCLEAMATAQAVDGVSQLQRVYLSVLKSPQTWASANFRSTYSNPLESVVKSIRISGIDWASIRQSDQSVPGSRLYNVARFAVETIEVLGLNYRKHGPPTGYNEDGASWLSKGYLTSVALKSFEFAYIDKRFNLVTRERDFTNSESVITSLNSASNSNKSSRLNRTLSQVIFGSVRKQSSTCSLEGNQGMVLKEILELQNEGDLDVVRTETGKFRPSIVHTVHSFSKLTSDNYRK